MICCQFTPNNNIVINLITTLLHNEHICILTKPPLVESNNKCEEEEGTHPLNGYGELKNPLSLFVIRRGFSGVIISSVLK